MEEKSAVEATGATTRCRRALEWSLARLAASPTCRTSARRPSGSARRAYIRGTGSDVGRLAWLPPDGSGGWWRTGDAPDDRATCRK